MLSRTSHFLRVINLATELAQDFEDKVLTTKHFRMVVAQDLLDSSLTAEKTDKDDFMESLKVETDDRTVVKERTSKSESNVLKALFEHVSPDLSRFSELSSFLEKGYFDEILQAVKIPPKGFRWRAESIGIQRVVSRRELVKALDSAERERQVAGSVAVEPVHLLLGFVWEIQCFEELALDYFENFPSFRSAVLAVS